MFKSYSWLIVAVLLLCGLEPVMATVDSASLSGSVWSGLHRSGTVGKALRGVKITLIGSGCKPGLDCPVAVTDAYGQYGFTSLVPGTYTVQASKAGRVTKVGTITLSAGANASMGISAGSTGFSVAGVSGATATTATGATVTSTVTTSTAASETAGAGAASTGTASAGTAGAGTAGAGTAGAGTAGAGAAGAGTASAGAASAGAASAGAASAGAAAASAGAAAAGAGAIGAGALSVGAAVGAAAVGAAAVSNAGNGDGSQIPISPQ